MTKIAGSGANCVTFVLPEGLAQGVNALDVEVVGGLVQDDHVGGGECQLGQRYARLLTARQVLHLHCVRVRLKGEEGLAWRKA
jgi:hypothetical protein